MYMQNIESDIFVFRKFLINRYIIGLSFRFNIPYLF